MLNLFRRTALKTIPNIFFMDRKLICNIALKRLLFWNVVKTDDFFGSQSELCLTQL